MFPIIAASAIVLFTGGWMFRQTSSLLLVGWIGLTAGTSFALGWGIPAFQDPRFAGSANLGLLGINLMLAIAWMAVVSRFTHKLVDTVGYVIPPNQATQRAFIGRFLWLMLPLVLSLEVGLASFGYFAADVNLRRQVTTTERPTATTHLAQPCVWPAVSPKTDICQF